MKILYWASLILVLIGALNWLLVGALGTDLVVFVFGAMPAIVKTIYILVGLGAIYLLFNIKKLTY